MIQSFYIIGSKYKMPNHKGVIYCDGAEENETINDVDIELSHWVNNRTPKEYIGDTSTEICLNFVEKNKNTDIQPDLAVNNHIDVDGLLSVFTLIHSELAIKNRKLLVETAEIGDFWGYGGLMAFYLCNEITKIFDEEKENGTDIQDIYSKCIDKVKHILENENSDTINDSKTTEIVIKSESELKKSVKREPINERFVHFQISDISLLQHSKFNELVEDTRTYFPHYLNKLDKEKVHLISLNSPNGTFYQLYNPSYLWAITKNLWRPPFYEIKDNKFQGHNPLINNLVKELNNIEKNEGEWLVVESMSGLFLSFYGNEIIAESSIESEFIIDKFSSLYI